MEAVREEGARVEVVVLVARQEQPQAQLGPQPVPQVLQQVRSEMQQAMPQAA